MWLLVAAFFVLGIGTVLYVQGWRLDLAHFRITKVGAIFIRSFPKEADIFLDGRAVKNKSGILQSGTFVSNLFPKNYTLALEAEGYKDWRGSIGVLPSLVTEVKNAVLVPRTPQTIATSVKNFWIKGGEVIVENGEGELILDRSTALTAGGKTIGKGEVLGWTKDLSHILTFNKQGNYFWHDLEKPNGQNITLYLKKIGAIGKIFQIYADEEDKGELIIWEPRKITLFDTERRALSTIAEVRRGAFAERPIASQFFIAWASHESGTSTVVTYDKILQKKHREIKLADETGELRWLDENNLAILQKNGRLYLYNVRNDEIKKLSEGVRNFTFSRNRQLLAVTKNDAFEASSLDGQNYYKFNLRDVREIKDVVWYNDLNHLFLVYEDKTVFIDLGDNSLGNLIVAAESDNVKYDPESNLLYFLEGSELKILTFPK